MAFKKDHPSNKSIQTILIGIITSVLLAVVKGVTGILGNSYALIADAIESISDIFTSLGVYLGLKIAAKPADKNHPYGHGKAEPMAAVVVTVFLFGAAVLIAFQSIKEIFTLHNSPAPFTLWVLAIVIIFKEVLFRYIIKVGEVTDSLALKTDAWHHRSDAITSAAVFIGILIALIGGKGYENADDFAALFASGMIFLNACLLLKPSISELMDESPANGMDLFVRNTALSVEGVMALDKCFVRKIGFDYYVDLHVIVNGKISVTEGHKISHLVKGTVVNSNPRIANVLVHIEPFLKNKRKYAKMFK
ncbi:cation transporter [Candidatus Woesearchaeota archaeon]|nr:cation transporter [Candidatus Woesearchaeota archaeon]